MPKSFRDICEALHAKAVREEARALTIISIEREDEDANNQRLAEIRFNEQRITSPYNWEVERVCKHLS